MSKENQSKNIFGTITPQNYIFDNKNIFFPQNESNSLLNLNISNIKKIINSNLNSSKFATKANSSLKFSNEIANTNTNNFHPLSKNSPPKINSLSSKLFLLEYSKSKRFEEDKKNNIANDKKRPNFRRKRIQKITSIPRKKPPRPARKKKRRNLQTPQNENDQTRVSSAEQICSEIRRPAKRLRIQIRNQQNIFDHQKKAPLSLNKKILRLDHQIRRRQRQRRRVPHLHRPRHRNLRILAKGPHRGHKRRRRRHRRRAAQPRHKFHHRRNPRMLQIHRTIRKILLR